MVQRQHADDALTKNVPTLPRKEDSVLGIGHMLKYAAMEDVPTTLKKEESVLGTDQKLKDAAMEDAPITPEAEESAWDMGQIVEVKDAAICRMY